MTSVIIGDGSTCLFWSDLWHGSSLNAQYPELFSFSRRNHVSVLLFFTAENKSDFFSFASLCGSLWPVPNLAY
jgi:hypothetical protein